MSILLLTNVEQHITLVEQTIVPIANETIFVKLQVNGNAVELLMFILQEATLLKALIWSWHFFIDFLGL